MAYVVHRPRSGGWLVRWRENGRLKSRFFADEWLAGAFADSLRSQSRRRRPGGSVAQGAPLADYLADLIASDPELRQASREVYGAGLRTHIRGTPLGSMPIDTITPAQLRQFWGALRCGPGARRNVYQLLAKALNQAVNDGLLAYSPLRRSGIRRPSSGGGSLWLRRPSGRGVPGPSAR